MLLKSKFFSVVILILCIIFIIVSLIIRVPNTKKTFNIKTKACVIENVKKDINLDLSKVKIYRIKSNNNFQVIINPNFRLIFDSLITNGTYYIEENDSTIDFEINQITINGNTNTTKANTKVTLLASTEDYGGIKMLIKGLSCNYHGKYKGNAYEITTTLDNNVLTVFEMIIKGDLAIINELNFIKIKFKQDIEKGELHVPVSQIFSGQIRNHETGDSINLAKGDDLSIGMIKNIDNSILTFKNDEFNFILDAYTNDDTITKTDGRIIILDPTFFEFFTKSSFINKLWSALIALFVIIWNIYNFLIKKD
jgi:hypothetical protein